LEKKLDELKSADHELRKEITHRKHEISRLEEDLERTIHHNQLVEKETESSLEQITVLKARVFY